MQTWAKRGIQTALVTGGLLMLGTGIASADEDVNPDRPASPLDGSLIVPINIDNNVIATPIGNIETPSVTSDAIDVSLSDFGDLSDVNIDAIEGLSGGGCPALCETTDAGTETDVDARTDGDVLLGNRIAGDLVVPIDISNNAIAAGGDAAVEGTSDQSVDVSHPQVTDGSGRLLAGNVGDLDYALPVQITGNAVSAIGNAAATSTATQEAAATGDIDTTGAAGGTLSGNVLAGQGATPVQVAGNAVSGIGTAEATSDATTEGTAGGTIWSDGKNSFGSGNVGAVPLAYPVEVNGNSVGGIATTVADSASTAEATAGDEVLGRFDRPTYIQTSGEQAALAGNVAQASGAGPADANCNPLAGLAIADAACESTSLAEAGGTQQTSGAESLLSGEVANPAVALPTDVFGNPVAAGGEATVKQDTTVDSDAGGSVFTYGNDSAGSGNVIAPAASGPADVFADAVAGAGEATVTGPVDTTTSSGGESGSSGPNSFGGGNMVVAPIAPATEMFGNVAGGLGDATVTDVTETKETTAGGNANTNDDGGFLAANLIQAAASGPVQAISNGAGVLGNTTSTVESDNTVQAGGDNKATGPLGTVAGNIGQAAVAVPTQAFGNNATAGGVGIAEADVDTLSTAGGPVQTDGTSGLGTGNVADVPAASALQMFGDSAAALGLSTAKAVGTTESVAGGDVTTAGTGGTVAGNVAASHLLPLAQGFGAAVAGLGGMNEATGENFTDATSGGDITTNGDSGTISGDLVDVPLAAVAHPFGDAVSAIGSDATAFGGNETTGVAGGTSTTSGIGGFLSGLDGTVPFGANVPIYNVPVEVMANALTAAIQASQYQVGEAEPAANLALNGDSVGGLGITDLPRLPAVPAAGEPSVLPAAPDMSLLPELTDLSEVAELSGLPQPGGAARSELPVPGLGPVSGLFGGLLGGIGGGMPAGDLTGALPGGLPGGGVPGLDMLGGLTGLLGGASGGVPGLPGLPQLPGAPTLQPRIGAPALPVSGLSDLPELPGLADLADLDELAGLESVSELVEALVDGDLSDLPTLSEVPGVSELPGAPDVSNLPGLGNLPGMPGIPAMPGLPSLTDTPVAQLPTLDRLPVHTPALSGLDTSTVLNPESASLADTRSKLAALFTQHPIG